MTTLILAGGFLGAGKTTLLLAAARRLTARRLRVGIVTNDQAQDLVDSALARQGGIPVTEVAGGCFCCRYPDLLAALATLRREVAPDVILAEPVGSCTDLLATVVRPLLAQPELGFRIAPLSVLLDPTRDTAPFAAEVDYLFRCQLAEAEVIVITRQDLPAAAARRATAEALALRFGPQRVFALSATTGEGVDAWLESVLAATSTAVRTLDIDYATYAAGEAALGWLNASGEVAAVQPFSPHNWLRYLLRMLDEALAAQGAAIAHLKAQLTAGATVYKASLTATGEAPTWDLQPPDSTVTAAAFLLNVRVQAPPAQLEATVRAVLAELAPPPDFRCAFTQFACFSPAAPTPTHRLAPFPEPDRPAATALASPLAKF